MKSDNTFAYLQGVSQGRDECEKEIAILNERIIELEEELRGVKSLKFLEDSMRNGHK